MYKVLTTKDKKEWNGLLEKTGSPDIYLSPTYLNIYKESYSEEINEAFCGEPILFFSGDDEDFAILTTIKRKVNDLQFLEDSPEYFDLISQYNYSGPIIKTTNKSKEQVINNFQKDFKEFCNKNNIVSEFIRFHPILNNHKDFKEHMQIDKRNPTVYIDLTKDEQTMLTEMNKKTRNLMRKAEKNGVTIEQSTDIKKFTGLYLNSMKQANASKKYLFPLKFFKNTEKNLKENLTLFTANYKGKIIAASLFMHKYDNIHYHFSGTDQKYRNLAPNQLLLWKVALWAKEKGYKKFHLGGGVNPNQKKDPLFHFKAGFSVDRSRFHTANVIHDNKAYKRLSILRDASKGHKTTDFFPYYRG
jgi:lipid II:glycine glycyltransferase (peptidoglycan interpeptide bridge formation enzyme)